MKNQLGVVLMEVKYQDSSRTPTSFSYDVMLLKDSHRLKIMQ